MNKLIDKMKITVVARSVTRGAQRDFAPPGNWKNVLDIV